MLKFLSAIKTAFLAASLGCALFVSGPALAETDIFFSGVKGVHNLNPETAHIEVTDGLLGKCAEDADTGDLRLTELHTHISVDLPMEVVKGALCVDAIKSIKGVGFVPVDVFLGFGSSTADFRLDEPDVEVLLKGPVGFLFKVVVFSFKCPEAPCRVDTAGSE